MNLNINLDLSQADLREANLVRANFEDANLHQAHIMASNLCGTCCNSGNLNEANLCHKHPLLTPICIVQVAAYLKRYLDNSEKVLL